LLRFQPRVGVPRVFACFLCLVCAQYSASLCRVLDSVMTPLSMLSSWSPPLFLVLVPIVFFVIQNVTVKRKSSRGDYKYLYYQDEIIPDEVRGAPCTIGVGRGSPKSYHGIVTLQRFFAHVGVLFTNQTQQRRPMKNHHGIPRQQS
jgi:hypothetical protein